MDPCWNMWSTTPLKKLSRNVFQALPSMRSSLDHFYTQQIGMTRTDCNPNESSLYNFSSKTLNCASQQFIYSSSFDAPKLDTTQTTIQPNPTAYCKIGLTVPDVDTFRSKLTNQHGTVVSNPSQLEDIGYSCHLNDPMGNELDILQYKMKTDKNSNNTSINYYGDQDLNPVCVGHITLRMSKEKESLIFYQNVLTMDLLSIQKCEKYNCLRYFFGYDNFHILDEFDDFQSVVESREWLWHKQYTSLELVYNLTFDQSASAQEYAEYVTLPTENKVGWQGIVIESKSGVDWTKAFLQSRCYQYGIQFDCQELDPSHQIVRCIPDTNGKQANNILKIKDPNGYPIFIHCIY